MLTSWSSATSVQAFRLSGPNVNYHRVDISNVDLLAYSMQLRELMTEYCLRLYMENKISLT